MKPIIPKDKKIKYTIYYEWRAERRSTATTQSTSPAVVKSNMFLKRLSFGSKECTEEPLPAFYILKMHMHFTMAAFFQLHFRQSYHESILSGPWLDCAHQQTDLGPFWVTLSGGIRDIAWRQISKCNKQLSGNCWHVARRPHDHCAITLGLPQDDRPMSVRFYGPCKGIVRRPCGLLTTIAWFYDHFWAKKQSKNLRCPHDHRAVPVRG